MRGRSFVITCTYNVLKPRPPPSLPPHPFLLHIIQLLALKRATIDLRQTLQEMVSVLCLNQFNICPVYPCVISFYSHYSFFSHLSTPFPLPSQPPSSSPSLSPSLPPPSLPPSLPLSLPPPSFQDPTSPEAVDLHSRLAQYKKEVKMVRQQSKNEEASDYNLLRTVLR